MPTPRGPWTMRSGLIALVAFGSDLLLFGWNPIRRRIRPDDWHGLLGADKRIYYYLPLLVLAIGWALWNRRAQRASASAAADAGETSSDREARLEAQTRQQASTERRRVIPAAARVEARSGVARFAVAGLSIEEQDEREQINGQLNLLVGASAFIGFLLGLSLFNLKGGASLASMAPALPLLAWRVRRAFTPSEVLVGVDGLSLRAPGVSRVLPIASLESAESTRNAKGNAVLVVVRRKDGRTEDLFVGYVGEPEPEHALVDRADQLAARIEATLAAIEIP